MDVHINLAVHTISPAERRLNMAQRMITRANQVLDRLEVGISSFVKSH